MADQRSHLLLTESPASVQFSVFAHMAVGRGSYPMESVLRGTDGESVWKWTPVDLLINDNTHTPPQLIFRDLVIHVPRAGRYRLALLAGEEMIGRQPLLIRPASAFQG